MRDDSHARVHGHLLFWTAVGMIVGWLIEQTLFPQTWSVKIHIAAVWACGYLGVLLGAYFDWKAKNGRNAFHLVPLAGAWLWSSRWFVLGCVAALAIIPVLVHAGWVLWPLNERNKSWARTEKHCMSVYVSDALNKTAIPGAKVTLSRIPVGRGRMPRSHLRQWHGTTDETGNANLFPRLLAIGSKPYGVLKRGQIDLRGYEILVECDGYCDVKAPLETFTGEKCDYYGAGIPVVDVKMMKPNRAD